MTGRRRGYVIVEMLLVMTALAIVLGLCVGLIHGLHRLSRVAADHLAEATTRDRLARQFRQDVRGALRSSLADAGGDADTGGRVALRGPEGRVVEYVPGDGRVVRNEHEGGRQVRREEYRFPSRVAARFSARVEDGARFVVLSLRRGGPEKAPGLQREAVFEAELGRDARLSRRRGDGS